MSLADRYTLLGDRLAKGSYGEVWAAWDAETFKVVAIKRQRAGSNTALKERNGFNALPGHQNVLAILHAFVSQQNETRTLNLVFHIIVHRFTQCGKRPGVNWTCVKFSSIAPIFAKVSTTCIATTFATAICVCGTWF